MALFNNRDHDLIQREYDVEWLGTEQVFWYNKFNPLPDQVPSAPEVVNISVDHQGIKYSSPTDL